MSQPGRLTQEDTHVGALWPSSLTPHLLSLTLPLSGSPALVFPTEADAYDLQVWSYLFTQSTRKPQAGAPGLECQAGKQCWAELETLSVLMGTSGTVGVPGNWQVAAG